MLLYAGCHVAELDGWQQGPAPPRIHTCIYLPSTEFRAVRILYIHLTSAYIIAPPSPPNPPQIYFPLISSTSSSQTQLLGSLFSFHISTPLDLRKTQKALTATTSHHKHGLRRDCQPSVQHPRHHLLCRPHPMYHRRLHARSKR
jgi:hypothetical protein